jgi:hypothetical protein
LLLLGIEVPANIDLAILIAASFPALARLLNP